MDQGESLAALDAYGSLATMDVSPTVQAGRYGFQAEAERRILGDVLPKLRPEPHHRLLDIGCGAGALLVPLSYQVAEAVGIDHPDTIASLERRHVLDNVTLIGGGFPDTAPEGDFDRIIAYSVLHYMADMDAAKAFILAAAALLRPGGRLVIGDLPNRDRGARWRANPAAAAAEREWANLKESAAGDETTNRAMAQLARTSQLGNFSDAMIAELIQAARAAGYEAYWLPQAPDLPFGRTREDLVVERI